MSTLSRVIENDPMLKITNEFSRLEDKCYLDNAGATLYPKSLITKINEDLLTNIYMNPHSDKHTNDCIDQIRYLLLQYFNTDPSNYSVIFTSGATQALKLVVETFNFSHGENVNGSFVYLTDNHTSVLGLRELAKENNTDVVHISKEDFLGSLDSIQYKNSKQKYNDESNALFVYPAQSSFNGFKYPIDCTPKIKDGCLNKYLKHNTSNIKNHWYILLDVACYVSTNNLDLSKYQPDFVCLSFYKLFGFPSGLGAIIVKNTSVNVLNQKKYFGGGTVDIVLASEDYHVKRTDIHERFEDGTIPFLSILALKHCFDVLSKIVPKVVNNSIMDTISEHTFYLAKDLYEQLNALQHHNGRNAVVLYMDSEFDNISKQGGIVTFNLLRADGSYIGYAEFQHMAELFTIHIRTGCFCNSGSCQRHLNLSNDDVKTMYKAGHKCGNDIDLVNGKPTGCIRASFGYYNTFKDVDRLVLMICKCFVKINIKIPNRTMRIYNIPRDQSLDKVKPFHEISYLKQINSFENEYKSSKLILREIAIFPIKSCGAYKVNKAWKIGPKGFVYDREWMIVKENGVCLTQKQNTLMCMIRPSIDLKKNQLILNYPGKEMITVSLEISNYCKNEYTTKCQSKVCTDIVHGYDCGDEVADWISEALQISFLRLIRQSDESSRTKKSNTSGDVNLLSLSNQAQFLLINRATVQWLSDKIKDDTFLDDLAKITDRFRANIVIDADAELVEREWKIVIIGKNKFKVEGLCSRCQMVCIDQQTGQKTVEPLRTISEQFSGKMKFGIYLSYIGSVDGSHDATLEISAPVITIMYDENISR